MRRILITSLLGLMLTATGSFAADDNSVVLAPAVSAAATTLAAQADARPAIDFSTVKPSLRRPALLPALYVGTAVLQGYDAYSTLSALKRGGAEQNPLMKNVVKSPVAFVALKAGIATASIMAAEQMWKNHNRVGAIVTMVASNGVMAYVAAHNASVLRSQGR
jgi:hypothetical protein